MREIRGDVVVLFKSEKKGYVGGDIVIRTERETERHIIH